MRAIMLKMVAAASGDSDFQQKMMLGSVSHKVAKRVQCSVMIVK
ncbi:universal stress protein [Domibacillus robiginosus]